MQSDVLTANEKGKETSTVSLPPSPPSLPLSEAIRLGAMLGPQLFGKELDGNGSCALGAALLEIYSDGIPGVRVDYPSPEFSARDFAPGAVLHNVLVPWDLSMPRYCPACFWQIARSLRRTISHLNDEHRWTREQIADWVEREEKGLGKETGTVSLPKTPAETEQPI